MYTVLEEASMSRQALEQTGSVKVNLQLQTLSELVLEPIRRGTFKQKTASKKNSQSLHRDSRLAMKTALSLVSDKATSHLGASAHLPKLQYCRHFEASAENDDFLECWARMAASSLHHPVGTVAMGEASDPSAVVDGHFRVRGVERLRVVDASVIPFALSSTPHSVVMLLAERAAEIISRS
ncbi:hypothetical protein HPB51_016130 [Rhipicephalus microplus]|uniref:Glucose-methanol-choline oxidoreductase C-terminal domain-containing protein n=1 Tax=Rhipicephalus microplus TaxID=6941 RepID=A0A9J6DB15_RHIMP|nr:hypothetical protein HPB51_016130 [Rhipicephalus microplus]